MKPAGDTRLPFQHLFGQFGTVVNAMVKGGLTLDPGVFTSNGLQAAKRFYDKVKNLPGVDATIKSVDIKERACRCAAQFAYFMLQGQENRALILSTLADELLSSGDVVSLFSTTYPSKPLLDRARGRLERTAAGKESRSRVFMTNCAWQLRNVLWKLVLESSDGVIDGMIPAPGAAMPAMMEGTLSLGLRESLGFLVKKFLKSLSPSLTARFKAMQRNKGPPRGKGRLDALVISIYEGKYCPVANERLDRALSRPGTKLSRSRWNKKRSRWRETWESIIEGATGDIDMETGIFPVDGGKVKNLNQIVQDAWDEVTRELTVERAVKSIFKPRKRCYPRCRFTGSPLACFTAWLGGVARREVERAVIAGLAPVIENACHGFLENVVAAPSRHLKRPAFTKRTIPLGLGEAQVYTIDEHAGGGTIEATLKFFSRQKMKELVERHELYEGMKENGFELGAMTFRLRDEDRFHEMVAAGLEPKLGTLSLKRGSQLLLTVPFKQAPPPPFLTLSNECIDGYITSAHEQAIVSIIDAGQPPGGTGEHDGVVQSLVDALDREARAKVASVDLGLKTLATMHVGEYVKEGGRWTHANPHHRELQRYFIDQEQLDGPRHGWLVPGGVPRDGNGRTGGVFNFKRRLLNLLHDAWKHQSLVDNFKNEHPRDYKHHARYDTLKMKLDRAWEKLDRLHDEIAKQVATRIVAACMFNDVDVLRFEDLSWSRHSKKRNVGYFLASNQVHWFFARVQAIARDMAMRHGITVEMADARDTSKTCSKCGERGVRKGKVFTCSSCGLQLDSDLNAARNIATAKHSPAGAFKAHAGYPAATRDRWRETVTSLLGKIDVPCVPS